MCVWTKFVYHYGLGHMPMLQELLNYYLSGYGKQIGVLRYGHKWHMNWLDFWVEHIASTDDSEIHCIDTTGAVIF